MKKVNIDDFLKQSSIEITMNGKSYVIEDISEETEQLMQKENASPREIAQSILGVSEEEIQGYGLKACSHIIRAVTDSFLERVDSQENQ